MSESRLLNEILSSVQETTAPLPMTAIVRTRIVALLCVLILLFSVFWPTFLSMVETWSRAETFTHGFLIFPISAFLVWRRWDAFVSSPMNSDLRAVWMLIPLGLLWTLASLSDVLVVEQIAMVAMIPAFTLLLLGVSAVRTIAFPLFFLLFAVPVGEALISPLIDFTAKFTVAGLRLSGIPVYAEGSFFSIPSGDWSVVEACSGVRYLIASACLGMLYAYLMYSSLWRKSIFVLLSIIVPIIANGLRAYLIVMIAHLSGMTLAVGVDHLIYGWAFFALMMFIMFWLGSYWGDKVDNTSATGVSDSGSIGVSKSGYSRLLISFIVGLVMTTAWPIWVTYLESTSEETKKFTLSIPADSNTWHTVRTPFTDWRPLYIKSNQSLVKGYRKDDAEVVLFLAYYNGQAGGGELINSQNILVRDRDPSWQQIGQKLLRLETEQEVSSVYETVIKGKKLDLLVWHWYWVSGAHMTNDYLAKLRESVNRLAGMPRGGAGIVIFTSNDFDITVARNRLERFVGDNLDLITRSLEKVREE